MVDETKANSNVLMCPHLYIVIYCIEYFLYTMLINNTRDPLVYSQHIFSTIIDKTHIKQGSPMCALRHMGLRILQNYKMIRKIYRINTSVIYAFR